MNNDIRYRLLDSGCILRGCLHDGPVSLVLTKPDCEAALEAEAEAGVPAGTVDGFLKALCREYGACGIAAVHGDMVVGQVRFFPSALRG